MDLICVQTRTMGDCYISVAHIRKITQDITGKRTLVCTGDNDYVVVDCSVDEFIKRFTKGLDEDEVQNE